MQKANDRTDNIIAVVLALIVYIPATQIGNIIRLAVVFVAYVMKHTNEGSDPGIRKIALCMVLSPFVSVFFVLLLENSAHWTLVIHEVQRMVFCALLLLTVGKMKVSFRMIYIITILVLIPNFIIQLLQRAHVESVFTFIRNTYESGASAEEWTHLDLAKDEGGNFRGGSIFINPNVYMVIPLMALVVFLHQDREKSSVLNYFLMGCAVYSCFLTGSRTGTIVMAVMMVWYIVKYARTFSKVLLIAAIIAVAINYGSVIMSSRSAKILDSSSFEVKYKAFLWYWESTKETFIYWFTGSLGSKTAFSGMDGELGHIYGWYGVFGVYWYFLYYKYALKKNKDLVFYNKPMTIVHLFVAFTASVLLCMPVYSFAAILIFTDRSQKTIGQDIGVPDEI